MKDSPKDWLLIGAFLLILVVFGALAVRKQMVSRSHQRGPIAVAPENKSVRKVLLYFGAPDASRLLPEAREIEDCHAEDDCVRKTVQGLIDGPVGQLVPLLPPSAVLLGIVLRDNTAELNFSRELISAHPGGSISELLTFYGLADTIAVNFPHLRQIRILVEGEPVETLKGHLGLREALKADFSYIEEEKSVVKMNSDRAAPAAEGGNRR